MPTPETINNPLKSPEEAQDRIRLRVGEALDDLLSLYDAMNRYGISRTALRNAVVANRMPGTWIGGRSRRILYLRRGDVIQYITLPMSAMATKRRIPWRVQDTLQK